MTCDLVSAWLGIFCRVPSQLTNPFFLQERPCTRCIKRNIGHLCHDEPREPAKKSKSEQGASSENEPLSNLDLSGGDISLSSIDPVRQHAEIGLGQLAQNRGTTSIVQPTPVAAPQASSLTGNSQPCMLHAGSRHGLSYLLLRGSSGFLRLESRFTEQLVTGHARLSSAVLLWNIGGVQ